MGRTIFNKKINVYLGDNMFNIDASGLPPGLYYLSINGKNGVAGTAKLTKL